MLLYGYTQDDQAHLQCHAWQGLEPHEQQCRIAAHVCMVNGQTTAGPAGTKSASTAECLYKGWAAATLQLSGRATLQQSAVPGLECGSMPYLLMLGPGLLAGAGIILTYMSWSL